MQLGDSLLDSLHGEWKLNQKWYQCSHQKVKAMTLTMQEQQQLHTRTPWDTVVCKWIDKQCLLSLFVCLSTCLFLNLFETITTQATCPSVHWSVVPVHLPFCDITITFPRTCLTTSRVALCHQDISPPLCSNVVPKTVCAVQFLKWGSSELVSRKSWKRH
jgi:hypothetical protein